MASPCGCTWLYLPTFGTLIYNHVVVHDDPALCIQLCVYLYLYNTLYYVCIYINLISCVCGFYKYPVH